MPRRRIAAALLIPEPVATEIEGLRRALGDGSLRRVAPHLTLVSPVNVPAAELPAVVDHVRAVAAGYPRLHLRLGPVATFAPVSPVLYLEVDGDVDLIRSLHLDLRSGPLDRPLARPFVPHVTVNDDCAADRIEAAVAALGDYAADLSVDSVEILEDGAPGPRRWNPIADARLRGRATP